MVTSTVLNSTHLYGVGGALLPRPKTIVVLGSSNGAGVGASGYTGDPSASNGWTSPPTSWAGLLTTALQAIDPDWQVYNRSVTGGTSTQAIARFWTDVAPHRPSHVILCIHPINDNIDPQLYLKCTMKLISMCRQIGAIPIIRGAYMSNNYNSYYYNNMLALNRQLDTLGCWRIDHFATLDNGAGGFIGGNTYTNDGLHPNDAGYAIFYSAIDLQMFTSGATGPYLAPRSNSAWRLKSGATGTGIRLNSNSGLGSNIRSFTQRARIKGDAGLAQAKSFMAAYIFGAPTSTALRIRNAFGPYEIADINGALGSASTVDPTVDSNTPHDLVMTYNHVTNLASFYIDGVSYGGGNPPSVVQGPIPEFAWGAPSVSGTTSTAALASFSEMNLWQVPLSQTVIADMAKTGKKPRGSIIFDADFGYSPPTTGGQGLVVNAVNNEHFPVIGEALWESVTAF